MVASVKASHGSPPRLPLGAEPLAMAVEDVVNVGPTAEGESITEIANATPQRLLAGASASRLPVAPGGVRAEAQDGSAQAEVWAVGRPLCDA